MSRISLVISLVLMLSAALSAQGSRGRSGSSPSPSTTATRSTERSSSGASSGRSSAPSTTTQRSTTTYGNPTPSYSPNAAYMRPADSHTSRPATYAPPTTAKGSSGTYKPKAATLKPAERGTINWMTLEEAMEKSKVEKRKIFIDMYTDWCGWCKHMDSTTFVNGSVAKYLNEHYYPVKFNAEQEKDIVFKDKTYHFKKNGTRGYHELAALWLNGRLSFPTVVFLDENQQLIQPVPGYQDAAKMEAIINYFGSDSHKKTPWESYEKSFSNGNK